MAESYHCRCIFSFLRNVQVVSRMCVLSSVCLFETVACQAILSMGFPRQDYWSGLSFSSSGDLPNPGIEHRSLHRRQILYHLSHQGSQVIYRCVVSSVQSSHSVVSDSATPWPAARHTSLSITNSLSLLKLMSRAGDAVQPSHPLSSPSPPAFNLSQHQSLFQ